VTFVLRIICLQFSLQKNVKGISVLEGLAATGLRAIRYAKEVEGVGQVIANDMDDESVASMERNIAFNEVGNVVATSHSDARVVMLQHEQVHLLPTIPMHWFFVQFVIPLIVLHEL
jgi:tRNA G26 N,N-dimethylase Trm1